MNKLIIRFDGFNGLSLPDNKTLSFAIETVYAFQRGEIDKEVIVGNHHIIDGFRLCVKRGIISYNEIEFRFLNQDSVDVGITINKDSKLSHWPKGFCDLFENNLDELLNYYDAN